LTSPYDLLKKAGLGAGLTSPALKRLEKGGLLASTPGPRNRQRYAITEKGTTWLDKTMTSGDASYWQFSRTDSYESLPRGIILAWLYSGTAEVHQGIARAADDLAFMGRVRKSEADGLRDAIVRQQAEILKQNSSAAKGQLVATTYKWLKAEADALQYRLQAEAVKEMQDLVAALPSAPQIP
jgi:DNA-binding PadR family transcriptional regulator